MKLISVFVREKISCSPSFVRVIDNISWLAADKFVRLGVGLPVSVLIARYLGPDQFGLINYALAFTGLFGSFATLGLQEVVVRDLVLEPRSTRLTLGTAAVLQLLGGILSFLSILFFIGYIRSDDLISRTIVTVLGAMLLFRASEVSMYWFESNVQSKYSVWVQNVVFLGFVLLKLGLISLEAPLLAFVWAMLAEAAILATFLLLILHRHGIKINSLEASISRAKAMLKDGWPLILSGIAIALYTKIDQVMLGEMINDKVVGIYSVAVRISEIWYLFIPIVLNSVFPAIARLHSSQCISLRNRWIQLYSLMLWLSLLAAFLLTLSSNFIVKLLFGPAFSEAASLVTIYVWAGVNVAVGSVWSKWVMLENKLKIALFGHLAGAVINIGLNLTLIPKYAATGAAAATLLSYSIANIFVCSLYKPSETLNYLLNALDPRKIRFNSL